MTTQKEHHDSVPLQLEEHVSTEQHLYTPHVHKIRENGDIVEHVCLTTFKFIYHYNTPKYFLQFNHDVIEFSVVEKMFEI